MKNIVLIGMPGVGKSTIGVILAKILGYQFIDSDLLIQNKEGKLLHEIINEQGLEAFVEIENNINTSIDLECCVIATGGSVVYGKEAMAHLKESGLIVYLKLPLPILKDRLGNIKTRGVVLREEQTLDELYEERSPLYEKYADITVEEKNQTIEETIQVIVDILAKMD